MAQSKHEKIERNVFLMIVLTLMTVSVGGLVEIVPLFFQRSTTQPVEGWKPYKNFGVVAGANLVYSF